MREYIEERLSNTDDDYRYRKYHSLKNHYSDDYQEVLEWQTLRNKKISKEKRARKSRLNYDNRSNVKRNNINNCKTFNYRRQYYD